MRLGIGGIDSDILEKMCQLILTISKLAKEIGGAKAAKE